MSWTKRLAQIFLRNASCPGSRGKRSTPPRARRVAVEPLEDRRLLSVAGAGGSEFDFGDLPDNYGTTLSADGARHEATGPTLGATRDAEADGLATIGAHGDGADEDGVTFGTIRVGQLDATVTVNVQNAPSGAKLDAWIDFNGDGSFGGPGERVAHAVSVVEGDNTLGFNVPSWAASGSTYARFRLSTVGGVAPAGAAVDGEVEDYQVVLMPPAPGSGLVVPHELIPGGDLAPPIYAADMDADGDVDLLSAVNGLPGNILLYKNESDGSFTVHTSEIGFPEFTDFFAADVDGDGDLDLLSAGFSGSAGKWYENDGGVSFIAHSLPVPQNANLSNSVFAADLDGDGDMDVLTVWDTGALTWHENDGQSGFALHTIATSTLMPWGVVAADVDGDGDIDPITCYDGAIEWHENTGDGAFLTHTIATSTPDLGWWSLVAADVDSDGDMDLVSASSAGDMVTWYENDGSASFTVHAVGALDGPRSLFAGDFDGDGDVDVLSPSAEADKIVWFDNDGEENFTIRDVVTGLDHAAYMSVADLDGDGDLDMVSASFTDDKILWYEHLTPIDFGDAPDSYGTTLVGDGARHEATGPTLGVTRDAEADGLPTAGANGDDTSATADEDGVTYGSIRVGQLDATVTVNVQNAPSGAKLDAWIDFNGDGSFGGSGERIAGSVDVVNGDNVIAFDVPSWTASGDTYARFRLSTVGDLGPRGAAADGEVEDYQVAITPPAAGGVLAGQHMVAETSVANSYYSGIRASDFNGDGHMDVLSGSVVLGPSDFKIAWHENDGSGSFTEHAISTSRDMWTDDTNVADVNGDGHMDLFTSAYDGSGIFWFENDGSGNFTEHALGVPADSSNEMKPVAADVNGDGYMDLLAHENSMIVWYENDGSESFTKHEIGTPSNEPVSVTAVDLNGDGHMDVLFNSNHNRAIAWYENDGNQSFTEHTIETLPNGARFVAAADINGDGHMDVVSDATSSVVGSSTLTWFENDGSGSFTGRGIALVGIGRSICVADVNGDGSPDVLPVPAAIGPHEIVWYANDGTGAFVEQRTGSSAATFNIVPADINGDGSLDFLTSWTSVVWHENPLTTDYGDAPDNYGTTLAADGARHEATGPTLGAARDADVDGLPTTAADGDDTHATDDEDGVTFNSYLVPGRVDLPLTVNVQDAPAGAKLDAWIDFDGNGTFDPGDQIADSIDVVEGDNLIRFNVPASSVAGQTYARFRLSSAGDLGPSGEAADGEVEDYQVTIYSGDLDIPSVDLGPIDFLEVPAMDLAAGPKAYSLATTYGGYLTVDAMLDSADGEATIRLVGDAGDLLGEATTQNGYARVDHLELTAGKTYALLVTGVNPDVDLRICNLVGVTGRAVTVHGTEGADVFQYDAGATHGVTINGIDYQFDTAGIDTIDFDGALGDDQAVLTGSTGEEIASFLPGSGSMTTTATGFVVSVANAAHITANSGGGLDVVELDDSTGDDTLTATPAQIAMSGTPVDGSPYTLTANGFRYAHGYARNGGDDTAHLVGSANSDRIKAYPDFVKMMGGGYFNRAKFFESTTVDMLDGADNGVMLPSDGADAVWAMKNDLRIARDVDVAAGTSPDYQNLAYDVTIVDCERFLARGEGGDDWVELHDSPGKDVLIAKPHKMQMMNGSRPNDNVERGEEYTITARGFLHMNAIADQGGEDDAAKLYDSAEAGVDIWAAAYVDGQTWSTMSSPSRLLYEVLAFEQVGGYGFNGGLGEAHGINRKDHADDVDFVFEYGYWEVEEPALPQIRGR